MSLKLKKNLQECHHLDDDKMERTGTPLGESLIIVFEIGKASVETHGVIEQCLGGNLGTDFSILSYCGSVFFFLFLSTGGNKSGMLLFWSRL